MKEETAKKVLPDPVEIDYGVDFKEHEDIWNIGVFVEGQYYGPKEHLKEADEYAKWIEPKKIWRLRDKMDELGFTYTNRECENCDSKLHYLPKEHKRRRVCAPCRKFYKEKWLPFRERRKYLKEQGEWDKNDPDLWPKWLGGNYEPEKKGENRQRKEMNKEYYEKNKDVLNALNSVRKKAKKELSEENYEIFKENVRVANKEEWYEDFKKGLFKIEDYI